jgi:hypothetical protein
MDLAGLMARQGVKRRIDPMPVDGGGEFGAGAMLPGGGMGEAGASAPPFEGSQRPMPMPDDEEAGENPMMPDPDDAGGAVNDWPMPKQLPPPGEEMGGIGGGMAGAGMPMPKGPFGAGAGAGGLDAIFKDIKNRFPGLKRRMPAAPLFGGSTPMLPKE